MPLMADSKVCPGCKRDLPVSKFSITKKTGYSHSKCNPCRSILNKQRILSLPDREREQRRLLRNARALTYKKPSFIDARRQSLKAKYGITIESFDALFAAQGKKCALCEAVEAGGKHNTFHVDHCHETGRVRGLLCHKCNVALGGLGDSYKAIKRALDYVTESNFPNVHQTRFPQGGGIR